MGLRYIGKFLLLKSCKIGGGVKVIIGDINIEKIKIFRLFNFFFNLS